MHSVPDTHTITKDKYRRYDLEKKHTIKYILNTYLTAPIRASNHS